MALLVLEIISHLLKVAMDKVERQFHVEGRGIKFSLV